MKEHQWDAVRYLLRRGYRPAEIMKVYGPFGLTAQVIYDRNRKFEPGKEPA